MLASDWSGGAQGAVGVVPVGSSDLVLGLLQPSIVDEAALRLPAATVSQSLVFTLVLVHPQSVKLKVSSSEL